MDIVDPNKNDKSYIKFKLLVKNWEKNFKSKFSRTPSKFDIKEAPANVKYAYKKYFQLKSAILETSLSICDLDDEAIESPEPVPHADMFACNSLQSESTQTENLLNFLPSGADIEKLLSNVQNIDRTKSETSSIPQEKKDKSISSPHQTAIIKQPSPFTKNLSKKLFENKKFSVRNPRKLSMNKSQSMIDDGKLNDFSKECNDNESLTQPKSEDFLATLNDESLNNSSITDFGISVDHLKSPKVRKLNEAWLQRATGFSAEEPKEDNASTEKFGLGNISVTNVLNQSNVYNNTNVDKIFDYVENSESETDDSTINKLKPALKKRKHNETVDKTVSHDRHNSENVDVENNIEQSIKQKSNEKKRRQRKRTPTKITIIDKEDPPDIAEYLPFGLKEDVAPRHLHVSDLLETVKTTSHIATTSSAGIDKLEKKIQCGTLNENFVKINIEKKVFVRGKKNFNYSKYKKKLNKDKKALHAGMEFPKSGKITCFKCGEAGHMARYCTAHRGDTLLPLENYDDSEIPTLEDMQDIVSKETNSLSIPEQLTQSAFEPSAIPESFLKLLAQTATNDNIIKPIYTNYQQDTPRDMLEALQKFGHESFRSGQEEAIKRILCGMSTLLILSTGGGKSLCYQLPAYIYSKHYKCITIVISPLVSLMEDQVLSMPEFLKAGCLHTNQTPTQRRKIIQCVKEGEINILLISPEALISGDGSNGFGGLFKSLPQIAFACIDEAHCVSQWSHNFRPSYLMICRVLREKLNVKCILGLTATASQSTIKSVISHIDIPDGLTGVITNPSLPDNLCLSVSFEKDKDRALVSLLSSEKISSFNSIIVYCIRRDECERVSAVLRSCLQVSGKINMEKPNNKRKRMSYIAEAYHAGMSAAQRKKIQKNFMDGTLKIIVATVAFGMGIDKSDIRCIIHYNTPSSFESYVQEVGRAGRDGKMAYCHVLMNNSNNDKNELLKHIHSNTVDRSTIRRLLQKVFIPCRCTSTKSDVSIKSVNNPRCKGHEVGIPIEETVDELDLPSENIATLLCYVELHKKQYIKVLNNAYTICKISSYGGPQKILEATKNCPPLAMAYLLESKKDPEVTKKSIIEFPVIEVAAAVGSESGMTKFQLKNLEWITEGGISKRSLLKVEFHTLGFRIKAPGDLSATELDAILDDLHGIVLSQEKAMLHQLEESHSAFAKLGNYSFEKNTFTEEILSEKSNELKLTIRNYFQRDNNLLTDITLENRPLDVERVASDVRALISSYKDCTFTGRSIARIFQGISSPNYPAIVWGRCKFWRSHIHEDFYGLIKIATQQIIQMK